MYNDILSELQRNISFTYGEQILDYNDDYICDIFSSIASNNIDIYYSDIFDWAKNNTWYIDESMKEYGNCGDIVKQIQMAQGYAYEQELYENQEDILKYYAYNYLQENEIDLTEEQLDDLDLFIEHLDSNKRLSDINDFCDDLTKEEDNEIY